MGQPGPQRQGHKPRGRQGGVASAFQWRQCETPRCALCPPRLCVSALEPKQANGSAGDSNAKGIRRGDARAAWRRLFSGGNARLLVAPYAPAPLRSPPEQEQANGSAGDRNATGIRRGDARAAWRRLFSGGQCETSRCALCPCAFAFPSGARAGQWVSRGPQRNGHKTRGRQGGVA